MWNALQKYDLCEKINIEVLLKDLMMWDALQKYDLCKKINIDYNLALFQVLN